MEDNKKNVLNNEPKKEEKEKKNKFLVWWLGLGKWAKVGVCAGGAVVLASAIIFPTLAATVWNKPAEKKEEGNEIVLDWDAQHGYKQYDSFISNTVNLSKDEKYFIKVDISKFNNFNNKLSFHTSGGTALNKSDFNTSSYVNDISVKSSTKTFTENKTEAATYQYYWAPADAVHIGGGSFSSTDKYLTISFVAKASVTNLVTEISMINS